MRQGLEVRQLVEGSSIGSVPIAPRQRAPLNQLLLFFPHLPLNLSHCACHHQFPPSPPPSPCHFALQWQGHGVSISNPLPSCPPPPALCCQAHRPSVTRS